MKDGKRWMTKNLNIKVDLIPGVMRINRPIVMNMVACILLRQQKRVVGCWGMAGGCQTDGEWREMAKQLWRSN
jgi:hypothetical protein